MSSLSDSFVAPFTATPKQYIDEFYAQLKIIDEFCIKHNIKYWLIGGTLLGQVRGKDFILWDDDNDVGIDEKDGDFIFENLRPLLQKSGKHDLWRSVHGLKLFSTELDHAGTDFFFYRKRPDDGNVMELASDRSRKQWPKDYFFKYELIGALPRAPFGPLLLPVPRNAERHLKMVYGDNCLTHARLNGYDHMTGAARVGAIIDVLLEEVVVVKTKKKE